MDMINNITLNIYSVLFLIILNMYSIKHHDNISANSKVYLMIIRVTIALLVFDCFSRFDGRPETIYTAINYAGNFLVFIFSPLLPSFWLLFVHLQLFGNESRTKGLYKPLIIINVIHGILVLLNLSYGWFYTIDPQNIYQRGPFFIYSVMPTISLLLFTSFMIFFNRKKTEDRYYYALMFFTFPPAVSIALQIYFYGTSLILNSVVFSLLIVFLNIQNKSIYTDHLTGVYNRNMLDKYLKTMIEKSTEKKAFSAIMVDLDDFKEINDTYGHDTGDQALQTTVKILKNSVKSNDFIARFGGDEFWLILNVSTEEELMDIVKKIELNFKKFNDDPPSAYTLNLSMGYALYNYRRKMHVTEFQKHLDDLMYINEYSPT